MPRPETLLILTIAGSIGALTGMWSAMPGKASGTGYAEGIANCRVTDGDTIRCGSERIRLLGIDAPELPGHCREGRVCVEGDPSASTASLENAMTGPLVIDRVGEDHYGRTLALVRGGKGDLSCWQLAHHQALYKRAWDNGLRIARICPAAIPT